MLNRDDAGNLPKCEECGAQFEDVFEAIDHRLDDDEEFDPALILPGGYKLMIGSLLRAFYQNRDNPHMVSEIAQSTYSTLFAAEISPEIVNETIEELIVENAMENLDVQLKNLLKNGE
jgi:hypothetical protein